MEYHQCLCKLLYRFRYFIQRIATYTHQASQSKLDIVALVEKAYQVGFALWKMFGGRAFQFYILNVEEYLRSPRTLFSTTTSSNIHHSLHPGPYRDGHHCEPDEPAVWRHIETRITEADAISRKES